jgi:hypothetical protein
MEVVPIQFCNKQSLTKDVRLPIQGGSCRRNVGPRGLLDFGSRTVPMLSHERDTSGYQFVIEFLSMSFVRRSSIDGIP